MEKRALFEEYKKAEKSLELTHKLKTLLSEAKTALDRVFAMEILQYLTECFSYLRMHDDSIRVLESEINQDFFNQKDERLKITDELVRILLRTEDFIKLKSLLFNRERYLTNDHQKVMQKFYYAVCHEGLKENKLAIEYLNNIKDNISSSNLVSKYLKLSMLHLKEKQIDKAKEYFNVAMKFDSNLSNPIFYLAESDILYYQKDYEQALIKYQEYFIKSKNTRRYLDRYILINIELNKLDEAWRFYSEFLDTMKHLESKNYRLVFYQAGLKLAKELNNISEIEKLEYLIEELAPIKSILNEFDNVYQLLSDTLRDKVYHLEREIIFDMFKAIDSLYTYQKLLYITKQDDQIKFYHFSKGLLLEKYPKITEYSDTLIEDLLQNEIINQLYTYDDLILFNKSVYKNVETQYFFVNGIKREKSFDYFCVYSKNLDDFDFQQRLVLIANQILKKQMLDFDRFNLVMSNFTNFKKLLNLSDFGLLKIDKGMIHLLNENAKKMLGTELEYVNFEDFQNTLNEKIFLDDLLYKNQMDIQINNKVLRLFISTDEFTIYIVLQEVKEVNKSVEMNKFIDLENEEKMLDDLKITEPVSLLLLDIRNYIHFFKDYNYVAYQEMLLSLIEHLKVISRNHFLKVYFSGFNNIYLVLKTIDKRVITRIVNSILEIETDLDIRIANIQLNHSLDYNKIIKLRYLISLTNKENAFINDNKRFRYNLELAKTLLININNLIDKGYVYLNYQAIGDWTKNSIDIIRVLISDKALLGEENTLKRVLRSANLESKWDQLIISSLIKDLKDYPYKNQVMIELSYKTIENIKELKKVFKKLETGNLNLNHYIVLVRLTEDSDIDKLANGFEFIKSKGCLICLADFNEFINLNTFSVFNQIDYLYIDIQDTENKYYKTFLNTMRDYNLTNILNHKSNTVTKSLLEEYNIKYLEGSRYPKYENVNGI